MKRMFFSLLFVVTFCLQTALAQDEIEGLWWVSSKDTKILIARDGDVYNGRIVWLLPEDVDLKDKNNPDKTKRDKPLLALELLHGFTFEGNGKWEDGKIYDPNNGKTYNCKMTLKDEQTLHVRGYIGISLLGRTEVFTRVAEDEQDVLIE